MSIDSTTNSFPEHFNMRCAIAPRNKGISVSHFWALLNALLTRKDVSIYVVTQYPEKYRKDFKEVTGEEILLWPMSRYSHTFEIRLK